MLEFSPYSEDDEVTKTYFQADLLSVMNQAVAVYPLPPYKQVQRLFSLPTTHDGLVLTPQVGSESAKTLGLIQRMAKDLGENPEVDMDYRQN